MEFNNIFMITVIIAAFICFRFEVEGAISTEELTSCVKWEEFNNGDCRPGTYKNDTDGECLNCPEGSYMKWFNTCPMCIRFTVCDEGDVISYPGDATNDRICTDSPPATDPQLIIDSPTPSESKKHKPYTEGSTSPTPDDLPNPTSKNSSGPPGEMFNYELFPFILCLNL
ncbi:uncharacterized protein [Apostichopus japonicus]|uniref:uncharacterized protein n=1 Tax=Stichopus japonicus TaxID=307972 RepID=UPI003AB7DF14